MAMQAFSRFLVEKINRLALLKVKRIFAIEAWNLLDFVKIIKKKNSRFLPQTASRTIMNKKHHSSYTSYLIFCNIQHTIGNVIIPQTVVTNTPPSA